MDLVGCLHNSLPLFFFYQNPQVHKISARRHHERSDRGAHLAGEPWYQEVIELRKQANDYKVSTMSKEHKKTSEEERYHLNYVCTMYKILF